MQDYNYLKQAVQLAEKALSEGNHPFGTVVVSEKGEIVAEFGNEVFTRPDVTAHAEMLCIRSASKLLIDKHSEESYTLYSSGEPCCGCAFYIARTNIRKVIFAVADRYKPGIEELSKTKQYEEYFQHIEIISEPDISLRDQSAKLIQGYFKMKEKDEIAQIFDQANLK